MKVEKALASQLLPQFNLDGQTFGTQEKRLTRATQCTYNACMNSLNQKEQLNAEQFERLFDLGIFKLLSEPVRLEILKTVAINGPSDITTISSHFRLDRSVVSKHLKVLYQGGLLIKTKESRSTIYQVDGLAFLQRMERVVSDVKMLLASQCGETFHDLYARGLTYKDTFNTHQD